MPPTVCIGAVAELELQKFTKTQNMIEELKLEINQSCFAFANVLLYEVPTYLAGCPIVTLNRKTKRKKR